MKIKQAVFSPGLTGFFFDDQKAIKGGAKKDGFVYTGQPATPGFTNIRMAGESISVMLVLDNGQVAMGDCAAVQYSGVGGRDPVFLAKTYLPFLRRHVAPLLTGMEIKTFRQMSNWVEGLRIRGKKLHTAIRYGLTQALLSARASAGKSLPCEVICTEYDLPLPTRRVPVFGQCGDNRYENADKMIIKQIDALSHGLINNVPEKLGRKGEKLQAYLQWLCRRIEDMKTTPSYRPTIHIDVYGTVGLAFKADVVRMADYLASLKKITDNLPLYIEGPVDMGEKRLTMDVLLQLRKQLKKIGADVRIVADEWCNTLEDIKDFADEGVCDMIQIKTPDLGGIQDSIESVLYCRAKKVEPYLGGSCNETDISSRMTVQIGLATQASRILIKPGMGFDEGLCVMNNEMERTLALLKSRYTARR